MPDEQREIQRTLYNAYNVDGTRSDANKGDKETPRSQNKTESMPRRKRERELAEIDDERGMSREVKIRKPKVFGTTQQTITRWSVRILKRRRPDEDQSGTPINKAAGDMENGGDVWRVKPRMNEHMNTAKETRSESPETGEGRWTAANCG